MRIVFWGTPEFARTVLRALLDSGREVVGVVTQPDRPAGRGRRIQPPPVKELASDAALPVLQPERPQGAEFLRAVEALRPAISIVAAYGHILGPELLELPPHGSINVHASLLPELRGAAPVNWAIIRGYAETGVTIMRMVQAMDAGPIILQSACTVESEETAGALLERLAHSGASALLEALALLESGRAREVPQDDAAATYAPKLSVDDARIDWSLAAAEIDRWIRGCDPDPAAWSMLDDLRVRIFGPRAAQGDHAEPGSILRADPRAGLEVAAGRGIVSIREVQPAGKRRMEAVEWIRGRGVRAGQRFR